MKKTGLRLMAAVALGVASFYSWAAAEQWPGARPISIIVPWTPGGLNDQMARMIAQHLSKTLNQPVIVENKPGAGSIIGS
jgi:tripartite-type tricarboxylate transporter receptor subunit TctC